jgi:hypothetical protein
MNATIRNSDSGILCCTGRTNAAGTQEAWSGPLALWAPVGKGVTFPRALAACGGGHIHVPEVASVEFRLRVGHEPMENY